MLKSIKRILFLGIILINQFVIADDIAVFVVKEKANKVIIEKEVIGDHVMKVFSNPSVLGIIFPLKIGKTTTIVKTDDRKTPVYVRRMRNFLEIKRRPDEKGEASFARMTYEKLQAMSIQVNIVNSQGENQSFTIDEYKNITPVEPVKNAQLFHSKLETGDYAVIVNTTTDA